MREDQTMQAILRVTRGDSGAIVVARTSALREDLAVVADAQVVKTWSDTAATIARKYWPLDDEFKAADVCDVVDVGKRQVHRVLSELDEAGYIERVDSGPDITATYSPVGQPGPGEVDLSEGDEVSEVNTEPGRTADNQYYTWNFRVREGDKRHGRAERSVDPPGARVPPAPSATNRIDPPS